MKTYQGILMKLTCILMLSALVSCGGNSNNTNQNSGDSTTYSGSPDIRDRNNEEDGDDTKQPMQDQDSVNRVLNDNRGKQPDTLTGRHK